MDKIRDAVLPDNNTSQIPRGAQEVDEAQGR